jgi:hypothetical protein
VGGRSLAFYPNRVVSSEGLCHQCEQESLVSGVATFNMVHEDPIVYPTSPPALTWISGRDPLLVVSIVTTQKILNIRIACYFLFWIILTSSIIMLISPCMFFLSKIIWNKNLLLFCLYGFIINPLSLLSFL